METAKVEIGVDVRLLADLLELVDATERLLKTTRPTVGGIDEGAIIGNLLNRIHNRLEDK